MSSHTVIIREIWQTIYFKMTYPSGYFDINVKVIKIASLWYFNSENLLYKTFCFINFIYCVVFNTPAEFISLFTTWGNINAFLMNLGIALTHFIASWKVINWFARRNKILQLMQILQDETYYYNELDNFKPNLIIAKAKRINITLTKMFFVLANAIPWTNYLVGFIVLLFYPNSLYSYNKDGVETYCSRLPFYSWIPFEHTTRISCLMATIFQFYPFTYLTIMIVAMDTLFMGLMNYVTAHLLVLQEAFRNIRNLALDDVGEKYGEENKKEIFNEAILEQSMMKYMRKCVIHFQAIQR